QDEVALALRAKRSDGPFSRRPRRRRADRPEDNRAVGRAGRAHGVSVEARPGGWQRSRSRAPDRPLVSAIAEVVMPNIVNPQIEQYLRGLYDDGDPVRREMEELAEKRGFPIVGPLVGRELSLLTKAIGAKRVFELGSGYGYSALYFGRAVGPEGFVHCTDLSPDNVKAAEGFLKRAGVWPIVTYHQEEATSAL